MKKLIVLILVVFSMLFIWNCKKEGNNPLPVLTTSDVGNIAQSIATSGGNITSDGGATITGRGVCWSIQETPTISDSKTTDGTGAGSFTSNITGLTPNTTYYVRAYATNNAGTGYGNQVSFTTMGTEQDEINKYLTSHNITTLPTQSGLYYLPTETGTGIKPVATDVVLFNYSLRLLDDKILATNIDSVAKKNSLYQGGVFYRPFEYRLSWWFTGLQEGFQLMHEGGSATFIIPSKLAYGTAGYTSLGIGSNTTVIFDIQLIKVIHDPVSNEKAAIEQYVKDSIPASKTIEINDSGVYHITDVPGTGDLPADSQKVSVRYTAKFLDGTIIEKVTAAQLPFSFTLGVDPVIPGFDQAIRKMKKGETAWVIIPYKQAYGERPNYYVNLPTFTTLVYYITIIDIH